MAVLTSSDFFPNNDISQARRQRIHKVIQLGAAWVTTWAKDVTHVMVDEAYYTYMQVLKSVNLPALPVSELLDLKHTPS
jgi:DNA polymerase IV